MIRILVVACLVASSLGASPRVWRPRLNGRIVGGFPADIEYCPYQLSFESFGSHKCGASIISANYAVTAGHCADGTSAYSVQLRAGSSIRGSGGSVHKVTLLKIHHNYDYYTIDYDIAIAKVATPFVFGTGVQPIALVSSAPKTGAQVLVSGWGTLSSGGTLSSQLQVVIVPIVDHDKCNKAYSSYGGITDRMICAGVDEGGKDSCLGDAGGPLVAGGKLAGIVSWGAGCASAGYPGVYSNVAVLRDFVDDNAV